MSSETDLVAEIETLGQRLGEAKASITKRFIGQERVVELTLAAMLCGGHALLIGLPGLGKTRLVETLSTVMGLDGNRVQFTPDLMPADILGSEVLETRGDGSREFKFIEGPIFCQLLVQIDVPYPDRDTERDILIATTGASEEEATAIFTADELLAAQTLLRRMPVGPIIWPAPFCWASTGAGGRAWATTSGNIAPCRRGTAAA